MTDDTRSMKILPAASGTCCMCATAHGEYEPHNYWSLFYGMRFKLEYGRDVTHADAIAHLSGGSSVRYCYKDVLAVAGRPWTEPPEGVEPIAEHYAESQPFSSEGKN